MCRRPSALVQVQAPIGLWQADAGDARHALYRLHDELNELNPSAALGLMEGLEETLTVHEFEVHARLRHSLSSTNEMNPVSRWSRRSAAK